jgi:putative hydrolase of the HAD superfamily
MLSRGIYAIAFDLDDTLYLERDFVFSGYNAVGTYVKEVYGRNISNVLERRFLAGERGDLFTPALQEVGLYRDEEQVKSLVSIYRVHCPVITPFEEVIPLLEQLSRVVGLALISDGIAAVQQRKLHALGIERYFGVVIFTDEWGRDFWKPHSHPFLECVKGLKCEPHEVVYIADNPAKDFITARALGMYAIRLRRKGALHELLDPKQGFEPDAEFPNLKEAIKSIRHLLRTREKNK